MKVELLYFDGCPSYEALRPRVERMLAERGLDGLDLVPIRSVEEAEAQRFLGSPTLRVDGHDVEPGAAERTDFGMKCRIYATADGLGRRPRTWRSRQRSMPSAKRRNSSLSRVQDLGVYRPRDDRLRS